MESSAKIVPLKYTWNPIVSNHLKYKCYSGFSAWDYEKILKINEVKKAEF
jgi:hypothetical protein